MTNKILGALEHAGGKLLKALGQDTGKAVSGLYKDTGKRVHTVVDHHVKTDTKIGTDFEKLELHRPVGDTPIYHVADDGTITRLQHNPDETDPAKRYRHLPLTQDDNLRLGLDPAHRGRPVEGEQLAKLKDDDEGRTRPRPTTASTEVPLGSTELARATQIARHADNSYGTHNSNGTFTSNNYAAARITGANNRGDFILVGRSNGFRHSERMIGTPFLRQGDESRIRELYSERQPCGIPPNCSSWMAERLPHVEVTHSVEFGDKPSRLRGNAAMEKYLGLLRQSR